MQGKIEKNHCQLIAGMFTRNLTFPEKSQKIIINYIIIKVMILNLESQVKS